MNWIRIALCALYTVVLGIPVILVMAVDRSGETALRIGRLWVRWILATCGVQVGVEGLENVPRHSPVIFMSNHQSLFDIAGIASTLPVSFRFVAKKELVRVPVFGWAMVASGHVIVDRQNRERAVRSLARAAERVRTGTNVIVFPEGTRSQTGELGPFKSGGFHLALQAQVPIVPVTVSGSQRITPKRSLHVAPGTIKVVYGKPIPTRGLGLEQRQELKDRVRAAILAGYDPAFQGGALSEPAAAGVRASGSA